MAQTVLPRSKRRSVERLVGAVVGALLLSGVTACTTEVTAAAVVGDATIPTSDLDDWTRSLLDSVDQEVPLDTVVDLTREELNAQVRHQVLSQLGLLQVQEEADLLALADQLGGYQQVSQQLGVSSPEALLDRLADIGSQYNLIVAAAQAGVTLPATVLTFDFISADTYAEAVGLKATYDKDPDLLTRDAALAAATQSGEIGATLSSVANSAFNPTGIFAATAGEVKVVAFRSLILVARVTEVATEPEQIDVAAVQSAGIQGIQGSAGIILSGLASDLSIDVNPRFGVWDRTSMQIINESGRR